MSEFRSLLPTWVDWGASLSAAVLYLLLGLLSMTIARRLCRPCSPAAHWTERAKQSAEDQALLLNTSMVSALFAAGLTWLTVTGVLVPGQRLTRAAGVAVLLGLFGLLQRRRYQRLVAPHEFHVPTWQERVFSLLMAWLPTYIALALALVGPAEWGPRLLLIQGGGLSLILLLGMGRGLSVCRGLGALRLAEEPLSRGVDRAGQASEVGPIQTLVLPTRLAQAYALGWCRTIVVTTGLLEQLSEDQVQAIVEHEVGHLNEPLVDRLGRLRGLVLLCALALWRFLVASIGWWGFAAVLALGWWLIVLVLRRSRELEAHADAHATGQGRSGDESQEEQVYAKALERLHEVNLAPAVTSPVLSTHPSLFDRMQACGLDPDYARPEPVGFNQRSYLLSAVPCAVLMVLLMLGTYGLSHEAEHSERAAYGAIALRGGHPLDIESLAQAWQDEHPQRAQVAQDTANAHPHVPGGSPPRALLWLIH